MNFAHFAERLRHDRGGSVAIIFALSFTALFGFVALALDIGRLSSASSKTTQALDRAALAGAKMLELDDVNESDIIARAEDFYNAQRQLLGVPIEQAATFNASVDFSKSSVTANAQAAIKSTFGGIIGKPTLNLNLSSTSVHRMKKVELAMALDLTGSMNDSPQGETASKLDSLKIAAKEIVDTLFDQSINEKGIRVALAPYSASINPGNYVSDVTGGAASSGCVRERPGPNNATDARARGSDVLVPISGFSVDCPTESIMPLAGRSQRDAIKSKIDSFTGSGWTAGHLGTAWGWYMLSPEWKNTFNGKSQPNDYSTTGDVIKNVLIMTDGVFNASYLSGYNADSTAAIDESYAQFQALCKGMRNKKINIFTVLYGLDDARAKSELQTCAGSGGNFYLAANGSDLKAAFRSIASALNSMRVSR